VQAGEFLALQRWRQIAGIAVELGHDLVERRADPWMKLHADFGLSRSHRTVQDLGGPGIGRDRVVEHVGRDDAEAFTELLEGPQCRDRLQTVALALQRGVPVKFLFGIDSYDETLAEPFAEGNGLRFGGEIQETGSCHAKTSPLCRGAVSTMRGIPAIASQSWL